MNRVHTIAFRLLVASLLFCLCFATRTQAQTPSPSPSQESAKPAETKPANQEGEANPFAPEPAAPLPAGMTGSDANDPRAKLTPGMYDAGETSMGIKHVMLLKKPDAFQLGSDDPDDPKVQKTLGLLGIARLLEDAEADQVGDCSAGFCELGPCVPGQSPVSWETFMASISMTSPIRRRPTC